LSQQNSNQPAANYLSTQYEYFFLLRWLLAARLPAFSCLRRIDLPAVTVVALVSRLISNKRMEDNKAEGTPEVSCVLIALTSQRKQDVK
jgi:hypothetical protein